MAGDRSKASDFVRGVGYSLGSIVPYRSNLHIITTVVSALKERGMMITYLQSYSSIHFLCSHEQSGGSYTTSPRFSPKSEFNTDE